MKKGVPLNEDQQNDAALIGVNKPKNVRLLKVKSIPTPSLTALKSVVETADLLIEDTIGITLRYGIYIREEFWDKRSLIVRELAHTIQYERLGSMEFFLKDYMDGCINMGYPNGSLEQETIKMNKKINKCEPI